MGFFKEFIERRAELYIKGLFNNRYFPQKINRSLVKAVITIVSRQVSKIEQGKHITEWLDHFFIQCSALFCGSGNMTAENIHMAFWVLYSITQVGNQTQYTQLQNHLRVVRWPKCTDVSTCLMLFALQRVIYTGTLSHNWLKIREQNIKLSGKIITAQKSLGSIWITWSLLSLPWNYSHFKITSSH